MFGRYIVYEYYVQNFTIISLYKISMLNSYLKIILYQILSLKERVILEIRKSVELI